MLLYFLCYYFILYEGNHSLYYSFDTLKNVTLMQGLEQHDFDALVPGRVEIQN